MSSDPSSDKEPYPSPLLDGLKQHSQPGTILPLPNFLVSNSSTYSAAYNQSEGIPLSSSTADSSSPGYQATSAQKVSEAKPIQGVGPSPNPTDPIDLFAEKEEVRSPGRKWLLLSILLATIAIGGAVGYALIARRPSSTSTVVETTELAETTLETQVDASGIVELGNQQTIKAPGDVTVETVLVEDQQRVDRGQVLLELRDRGLQQEIADQMLQQKIDSLELERKQALLMQQAVVFKTVKERLAETRSLVEEGFISESEYDQDKDKLEEARAELQAAEIDVKQADITLMRSDTNLGTLESQLADNQISAPFDALVLKIDVQPGDGVSRENPLLTLGNPEKETIRFELSTLDAQSVAIGMPVRVSVIGPDAKKYEGRVDWISPQAIATEADADQSQPKIEATAILDRPSGELIPGSAVSIEIITAQRKDVLSVPITALVTEGEQSFVWIKDAQGNAQKQAVTLGLQTLEATEITSGLSADDNVVISPPEEPLQSGMPLEGE